MTGLRVIARAVKKLFAAKKKRISASSFRPEVKAFTSAVLTKCIASTPARSLSLIRTAQRKQYANRIDYIPSIHTLQDPTLIVKGDGAHWLLHDGKWYHANLWNLKPDVFAAYQFLLNERQRRMETSQADFIAERAQARFLYKRSWWQVAGSLGVYVTASGEIVTSHSRRKPPESPPSGYGQWHGGKLVLSVSIHNPFLEEQTAYWKHSGKKILDTATASAKPKFERAVKAKIAERLSR